MYQDKYRKYKRKYLELKTLQPPSMTFDSNKSEIDWYLYFDLQQLCTNIKNLTEPTDIIILVGDTPSYVTPFINKYRTTFNLPMSNKPFGCFWPKYADPEDSITVNQKHAIEGAVFVPTVDKLNAYFTYLDTKTILTKQFVRQHWNDIILVDSSSGQSIHGVSIFFNRYIGNIIEDKPIECTNIIGANPLKFIGLVDVVGGYVNLCPASAKKFAPDYSTYRPDLIIYLGSVVYMHRYIFMITENFARFVPSYFWKWWNIDPNEVVFDGVDTLKAGAANIKLLDELISVYAVIIKGGTDRVDRSIMAIINKVKPTWPLRRRPTYNQLAAYLYAINLTVLQEKNSYEIPK